MNLRVKTLGLFMASFFMASAPFAQAKSHTVAIADLALVQEKTVASAVTVDSDYHRGWGHGNNHRSWGRHGYHRWGHRWSNMKHDVNSVLPSPQLKLPV